MLTAFMVKKLANIFLSTLRKIFLVLFSIIFLFSSQSFAAETKPKTAQIKQEFEDPDLKLSIEELRKKYPIDWLAKKYGDYNEYCRTDDCEYNCPTKPKNLVCTFYYDPFRIGYFEDAKKVSLDDFSESEIKSVFVNYGIHKQLGDDGRLFGMIDVFIDHFMNKKPGTLIEKEERVLRFAFAPEVIDNYTIECDSGKHYLDKDYCGSSAGAVKEVTARHKVALKVIKQQFRVLFSSKFNINLN